MYVPSRDFNEPWNFLAVQLTRSSESGDPDLYGIFTGGPNSQVAFLLSQIALPRFHRFTSLVHNLFLTLSSFVS